MLLKINLIKAYDIVNWIYIIMLMTYLGFEVRFINWVMSCITSVSFVVLIDSSASSLFQDKRGLCQGCPLLSLFFLLVTEGLRKLLA